MLNSDECKKIENLLNDIGKVLKDLKNQFRDNGIWIKTQFKSEADLLAERLLKDGLNKICPLIPILSEEDNKSHKFYKSDLYWMIDPIDGTASYCNGFSGYVIQLALISKNLPIFSFIFAPELLNMYTSQKDKGSRLNGKPISVLKNSNNFIMTDNYPNPRGFSKLVYNKLECSRYIESGSIGLKICLVASGDANLFIKNVTVKDWDLAPAHLLLKESGGFLFDFHGNPIEYNNTLTKEHGIIAINAMKTYKLVEDRLDLKSYVK